jgi:hypothetical protein
VVNISDHRNPSVEVWTPGASEPAIARESVSVAGIDIPLGVIFDRLSEIPPDEALDTREGTGG